MRAAGLALILGLLAAPAAAEVVDAQANGFQVRETATVAASPDRVWAALVDLGGWWNPAHTYSGDAANLSLEPKARGCWCERLANGGSVQHMTVIYVAPGEALRAHGGLGPLQGQGLDGALTFAIKPEGAGSAVSLTYVVGGYMPGGAAQMAAPVDEVLGEQLARLKAYAEIGKPTL